MSYLVEIFLPVRHGSGGRESLGTVRDELTAKFGGVTLHANYPAEGLWKEDGQVERDSIVVAEVMTEELDRVWWIAYRKELDARLKQDEVVIRTSTIERL